MAEKKGIKRVILTFGYQKFIMSVEAGTALFTALSDCEEYTTEWDSDVGASVPKVSPVKVDEISLSVLSEEQYALGKLTYAAKQTKQGAA